MVQVKLKVTVAELLFFLLPSLAEIKWNQNYFEVVVLKSKNV